MPRLNSALAFILMSLFLAQAAWAGVATFTRVTDSIQVSGQSVIDSAATIEAVVLLPSGATGGLFFNEWTEVEEDKRVSVSPTSFQGFLHPIPAIFGGITLTADEWHHVAFVYDGQSSEQAFYVDGERVGMASADGTVGNGDGIAYVGAIPRDGSCTFGFIGQIDSLRVSTIARYSGETFTPPVGNMTSDDDTILLYNFEEPPGSSSVADSSPLARTGTLGLGCVGATAPALGEGGGTTTTTVESPTTSSTTTTTTTGVPTSTSTTTSAGSTSTSTTTTTASVTTTTVSITTTTLPSGACGDPVDPPALGSSGSLGRAVTASDALNILLVAVGADDCLLCICDVDDSGGVTATDALAVLAHAVGQSVTLTCPPCGG